MIVDRHGNRVLHGLRRSEFDLLVEQHRLTDLDQLLLAAKWVGLSHSQIARALRKNKGTISRQIRAARHRATHASSDGV